MPTTATLWGLYKGVGLTKHIPSSLVIHMYLLTEEPKHLQQPRVVRGMKSGQSRWYHDHCACNPPPSPVTRRGESSEIPLEPLPQTGT